jgi:vitamin B12/bleomycin/antimicrobial peptide transport system ATP-binding/permease protein
MAAPDDVPADSRRQWSRFWRSASGFWRGRSAWSVWSLCAALVAIVALQLYVQYQLNYWNRDFFNALERRDGDALRTQALLLLPLCAASIALAVTSVWGRMTMQRRWREWLTTHLIRHWLDEDRYFGLARVPGESCIPEYRIAEDARMATDAPIDFAVGVLSSLLTAFIFIQILWNVGGDATLAAAGLTIRIPGYLVISVVIYSGLITTTMLLVGAPLTRVIAHKNQAEAELITAAHGVRDIGEGSAPAAHKGGAQRELWAALQTVLAQWRKLCWQLVRTTLVSQGNTLLAPIIGLVLCAPKFLAGAITLGEMMQAAAAFTIVQSSFGWLVDNYNRVADWASSIDRVGTLLLALDELDTTPVREIEAAMPPAVPVTREIR